MYAWSAGLRFSSFSIPSTKKKINLLFKKRKIVWTTLLLTVSLIILSGLLITLVNFLRGHQIEESLNQQLLNSELQQQTGWSKALLGLQIVLWAPFFEELIFRWLVFETFGKSKNYFSVLISTFTFAFAHYLGGQNVIVIIPYLIMGGAFAYIYRKKNYNILWPMAFHFSWNLVVFLFMLARKP